MERRTFVRNCAAALTLAAQKIQWALGAEASRISKPWPRPPVKKLVFDDNKSPSYSAMAALTPLPGTKRIYLQQPCDYKIVTARPDLKFQIYNALSPVPADAMHVTGYGFVIVRGSKAVSFDYGNTEQHFENNRLPLLTQRVSQDGFDVEQKSFTTTGHKGRPLLMVRLKVTRRRGPRALELAWLTVRNIYSRYYSYPNEDYIVFEPWGRAWESPLHLERADNSQRDGDILFDAFQHSRNVSTGGSRNLAGSTLIFGVSFAKENEAVIDLAIPYEGLEHPAGATDQDLSYQAEKAFRVAEEKQLLSLSFDDEYRRQTALWNHKFENTAAIEVPEKLVQDVYHVLTCNDLQFLGSGPQVSYLKPGQGGFNSFSTVYGWESSNYLPIMDQQGFHHEVGKVLDYYLTTQHGHHGPEGDISTAEGSFRPHIHWMCETGAILGIFAEHAFLSGDFERLRKDAPALLKAARWIQGERARTRDLLPDGSKSIHYGLMPPGRATDWPEFAYSLFTDAYTWRGLDQLAQAFETAKFPEATWLRAEADDYRQCILQSAKKIQQGKSEAKPVLFSDSALLEARLIDAKDDVVKDFEAARRKSGELNDLFARRMPQMEDDTLLRIQEKSAGGEIDLYYVNFAEKVWHRLWLERGETVKALRYFYMTLAYSTSRDVHIVSERFCPQLIWLLPWQPNASGNGRVLEMIFNTLCLESGDSMKLLHGAPDAWFAARRPLGVKRLRTSFGIFSFHIKPAAGKPRQFEFTYECTRDVPSRFLIALPDGKGRESRRVIEVDTQKRKSATRTLDAASGRALPN
ncbi:MAG: hypothetical protein M1436_06680 [Acidobacteria bacterium]|nr:hypothetical protein [Acidobacteriota bacterium]